MYLIRGLQNIKLYKQKFANSQICATIGNFDGLHIGHQHILSAIKKHAEEKNFSTMVFLQNHMQANTFQTTMMQLTHPQGFVHGEKNLNFYRILALISLFFLNLICPLQK